ncbi:ABC transporter ATP-binding protein [Pseudoalteromonas haloplanktis]|uniref:ABC transporter ATP-binding protein n=1 Tax=Pseudoalteromonas haloplanktis TaxID=228 RepID=A0ABU1BG47_PSEHA|nr:MULTISPECIES: ABC transporter ATP-binding protein [Pseudoalteromonas]MDQ9093463.1 ABC transporter ATP-binding protein [Pseudoalteromonas haloplanktis]BDF94822.1 ABC transporter ATP-binding protein [Pseudoalteromonas sp. KAN5]
MTQCVIKATQLDKYFGDLKAIDQLDLAVEKGQIYGFLGPNGCGKTTAIRMLTGLLQPTNGHIEVLGLQLPRDAEQLRTKLGYMTQKFSLYGDLTVYENLNFIASLYSFSSAERRTRIDELLHLYGLDERATQLAASMSGGQRQRLSLAAAVMNKPQILFLDEPTSAVDPQNRRDFWETLFDLSSTGTTILVTTHYMDEAERCHKLAILEAGVKRADGTPKQLMADMDAHVIEVSGAQTRQLKSDLANLPEVLSATQLGAQLRVLVRKDISQPLEFLRTQKFVNRDWQLHQVRPSLEDVFVTCTGQGRQ